MNTSDPCLRSFENFDRARRSLRRGLSLLSLVTLLLAIIHPPAARAQGGTWTKLKNPAPASIWYSMILLPDGSVMCQEIATPAVATWHRLTPDRTGSYVNGTWTTLAPMNETRNTNGHQVLRDGRVLVVGGEYGTGIANAEVYNPLTDTWTRVTDNTATERYSDCNTEMLPDGRVLIAPTRPSVPGGTVIYDPATNALTLGPRTVGNASQGETCWVMLPDSSILTINSKSTVTQRYIPAQNQWVADATMPVNLWVSGEIGLSFLLANGKVLTVGANTGTALYTPSGNTTPGSWAVGPTIPDGKGVYDGGGVMLVNGRVLFVAAPVPTAADLASGINPQGVSFYEYDPVGNTIAKVADPAFTGRTIDKTASYEVGFLALPDGSALMTQTVRDLWVYRPNGAPLAAAKPTISSITQNSDGSYHLVGTLLNGISEGACYGDDAQLNTNRPLVRITDAFGTVSYARTFNWSSTGVMTGSTPTSTEFAQPYNGTYSLVVTANGVASDPTTLVVTNGVDGPPSITTQPIARSVQSGASTTFAVTAVGTGTFNYQWQAQEAGSTIWNNVANGNGVSGATTATLSITAGAAQNGLSYRALVQNTFSAASDPATLLVASPLTLSTFSGAAGSTSPVTGTVSAARYSAPQGIALDAAGNIYVADTGHHIISKINVAGNSVTTLAGTSGSAGVTDGTGTAAKFSSPWGIALDSTGNVYVADSGTTGNTIRKITPAGVVTTLAGSAGVAGSADGTGAAATFNNPRGLVVDATGNVFVCDTGNHTIRKITPAGVVTTFAGTVGKNQRQEGTGPTALFGAPVAIAIDPTTGNFVIGEGGADAVRRLTPAAVSSTIAGNVSRGYADGVGKNAIFSGPNGVAVNVAGEIFVADSTNNVIRKVSPGGAVTTVAGTVGTSGSADGTGSAALFNQPFAVAISPSGQLYIADRGNNAIRTSATVLPPLFATQPATQTLVSGSTAVFTAAADSTATSYQWQFNGANLAGATNSTLVVSNATSANAGNYTVVATGANGRNTSTTAALTLTATTDVGRLVNLSILTPLLAGETMTMGTVLGGGGSGSKALLVRAAGPSLGALGVPGTLPDPKLALASSANPTLDSNDNWGGTAALTTAFAAVGAFPYAANNSKDAAIYRTDFAPGGYTVAVSDAGTGTGTVIAELYDSTPAASFSASTPRLINVSVLKTISAGTTLTVGFVIGGSTAKTVLVRAVGPGLAAVGVPVSATMPDPQLALFNGSTQIASNDNWGGDAKITTTGNSVGAFALPSATTKDAVLLVTLAPGQYSAQVSANGAGGLAIVEVYDVP